MTRNLLVTLADRNYLDQAKQMFSSAYWNAGWAGDYLLLAHQVPEPELRWFAQRGILTQDIRPLSTRDFGGGDTVYSATVTGKLGLFSAEFKKWETVIFIDADTIVRYPLDALTRVKGFAAVRDWLSSALLGVQATRPGGMGEGVGEDALAGYDPYATAFNTGVMAFKTDLIGKNTFEELCEVYRKHRDRSRFGEQLWLNLYWYRRWAKLPLEYNLFASYLEVKRGLAHKDIDGVILHFPRCEDEKGLRCWDPGNAFYGEWKANLDRAEGLDLKKVPRGNTRWPRARHLLFGMWKLRMALRRDYASFYRNKLRLKSRARGLLAAVKPR